MTAHPTMTTHTATQLMNTPTVPASITATATGSIYDWSALRPFDTGYDFAASLYREDGADLADSLVVVGYHPDKMGVITIAFDELTSSAFSAKEFHYALQNAGIVSIDLISFGVPTEDQRSALDALIEQLKPLIDVLHVISCTPWSTQCTCGCSIATPGIEVGMRLDPLADMVALYMIKVPASSDAALTGRKAWEGMLDGEDPDNFSLSETSEAVRWLTNPTHLEQLISTLCPGIVTGHETFPVKDTLDAVALIDTLARRAPDLSESVGLIMLAAVVTWAGGQSDRARAYIHRLNRIQPGHTEAWAGLVTSSITHAIPAPGCLGHNH